MAADKRDRNVARWRDPDAREAVLQFWSERNGIWLAPEDCRALLDVLKNGKQGKRGRPSPVPHVSIATYSMLRELEPNTPTEAAVAATVALYGIKRSIVFAARRRFRPEILSRSPSWLEDSEKRQWLREFLEAVAAEVFQPEKTFKNCQAREAKRGTAFEAKARPSKKSK
jgi:hypothetical protein